MYMYAYTRTYTDTCMHVRVRVDVCVYIYLYIFRKTFGFLDWRLIGKVVKNMINMLGRQGQTWLLGPLE